MEHTPELLAPAGGMDALCAAVSAGADAVYLGLGDLDARAAAPGVDICRLPAATRLAHAHGARVYVTLNALMDEASLGRARDIALRALDAGADALIVADPALMVLVHEAEPAAELHLSTQAGAQAPEAVAFAARELAAARVTCARELTLPEISRLCGTGADIEAFCHGAICIGYSGACSFSALRRGRSAMCGDCTQPCRLSYELVDAELGRVSDERASKLLCPRDYLGIGHVAELCRAGVSALKIEGRMKNPDYVYNVVGRYREALDATARGGKVDLAQATAALGRSFNRGFTDGYLVGETGRSLMSPERSCNQGVYVGRVVERRIGEVAVALEAPVHIGDTLEIRSTPGPDAPADVPERWPQVPCAADGAAGERVVVRCKRKVELGSPVHLIRSAGVLGDTSAALEAMRAELARIEAARMGAGATGDDGGAARPLRAGAAVSQGERAVPGGEGRRPAVVALAATPAQAHAFIESPLIDEVAVEMWRLEQWEADGAGVQDAVAGELSLVCDEVARASDLERLASYLPRFRRAVCRNMGQIDAVRAAGTPFDVAAPIPMGSSRDVALFVGLGADRAWLADELSPERICGIASASPAGSAGALVFGRPRLMTCEHCILGDSVACAGACDGCAERRRVWSLREARGAELPVEVDLRGRTRIFDAEVIDRVDAAADLAASGAGALLIDGAAKGAEAALAAADRLRGVLGRT